MAGASNTNGNVKFYHSHLEKSDFENGFSAVTPKTLYGKNATSRTVRIIRLASWIQDEIEGREIPIITQHSGEVLPPKVIMKLDIEGLEFKVFPDLLTSGALCNNIHYLMGEFHFHPGNINYFPISLTSDGKNILTNRHGARQLANQLLHMVNISENCMTKIALEDDESYPIDPHDLPQPSTK